MSQTGISKLDLKRRNRTEILKLLAYNGPMSRIDIARNLKLTRAAVTIITNEMIEQGIVSEIGEQKQAEEKRRRGRKKILLDICKNYRLSFGVVLDIERTHIGLADLKGTTLAMEVLDVKGQSLKERIDGACNVMREWMRRERLPQGQLLGVGICISDNAFPALGYQDKQECYRIARNFALRQMALPVMVDGTAESLAVAELVFSRDGAKKPQNVVLLRYGYDVDAAVMVDGKVYKGHTGKAGCFAHMVVDTQGERCFCGKAGCCITKMSIQGIVEKIKKMYSREQTPYLYQISGGDPEKLQFTVDNLRLFVMDEAVQKLYQEALSYLTTALDNILNLLDPERIILFGFVFEKILDLDMLTKLMEQEHNWNIKEKIILSCIPDSHIHLAGCGICVSDLFIEKGGM